MKKNDKTIEVYNEEEEEADADDDLDETIKM